MRLCDCYSIFLYGSTGVVIIFLCKEMGVVID